jgi:hypothetical protein
VMRRFSQSVADSNDGRCNSTVMGVRELFSHAKAQSAKPAGLQPSSLWLCAFA